MIKGNLRQAEFRGKQFIYGEIINHGFLPDTELRLHAKRPENPIGYVVKIHKDTIKKLRRFDAWKVGLILMQIYQDRPMVT